MKKLLLLLCVVFVFTGCTFIDGLLNKDTEESQTEDSDEQIVEENTKGLFNTLNKTEARSRDAQRHSKLSLLIVAIEVYNVDHGFPKGKGCISDIFKGEENVYFKGGEIPMDPLGEREDLSFDPGGCISKGEFYYDGNNVPGVGEYMLITVMEMGNNNNILGNSLDMEEISKFEYENDFSCPENECDYYAVIK